MFPIPRISALVFALAALVACEPKGPTATTGLITPGISDQPTGTIAPTDPKTLDPADFLGLGKLHFAEKNYGLAEKNFRAAIEKTPQSAEAWLGLAASYDQLRRFQLADRAYAQVLRLGGPSAEAYNNRAYSYMMRGDLAKAGRDFRLARRLAPDDVRIANNLRLLSARRAAEGR
jgi:Flp pilus assembly protein TadD